MHRLKGIIRSTYVQISTVVALWYCPIVDKKKKKYNNNIIQKTTDCATRDFLICNSVNWKPFIQDDIVNANIHHIYTYYYYIFFIFVQCVLIRVTTLYDSNNYCYLVIKQICNSVVWRMLFSSLKIFMSRLYFVGFSTKSHFSTHVTAEYIHAFTHTHTQKHVTH